MPGVQVVTATRSAPSTDQLAPSSSYFVAGQTERGPVDRALRISSLSDFEALYGGRVSYGYVYDDVATFFEEGGTNVWVSRVAGPAASVSSLTLVDRAGSPVATLRIDAYGPGAWGQGVTVDVDAGGTSGTYKIIVAYSGTGAGVVEIYDNLVSPADAVAALANSAHVRAFDLASATAAPNNQPALSAATALASGSDDRGSITTSHYTAALTDFSGTLGAGAVAIPGQPASAVGAALVAHAAANNRIALLVPASVSASGPTSAAAAITAKTSVLSGISTGREHAGFFWPWIKVPNGVGGTRTIPPEGFIAAKRAQAHENYGPSQPPAATFGEARYVLDVEVQTTEADVDTLNAADVSPITVVAGINRTAIQLYGWRSLSSDDTNYALLSSRDLMNYVAANVKPLLAPFVYRPIDGKGRLFYEMGQAVIGLLDPLRADGQLYERLDSSGNLVDPGYSINTGPGVNTDITKQANIANVEIAIRPPGAAELIKALIVKVPVSGAL